MERATTFSKLKKIREDGRANTPSESELVSSFSRRGTGEKGEMEPWRPGVSKSSRRESRRGGFVRICPKLTSEHKKMRQGTAVKISLNKSD